MFMSSPLSSPSQAGYLTSDSAYMTAPASPNWFQTSPQQDPQPSSSSNLLSFQPFSSPDTTPAAHAALTARRHQFYQARPAQLSRPRYGSAGGNHARPVRHSGDAPLLSDSALEQNSPTRQVWRTKFRERCRMQMARDRARALAKSRGGEFQSFQEDEMMLTPGAPPSEPMPGSDDLPSSDIDVEFEDEEPPGAWQQEDEELIRRVMVAEYRRIKRQHEASGQREVGWLDADELSYLEEEMRREATQHSTSRRVFRPYHDPHRTPTRNVGPSWQPGSAPMLGAPPAQEPPEDMVDEDEFYSQQFLHHHRPHNDDEWDHLDRDFEAQLANLPIP